MDEEEEEALAEEEAEEEAFEVVVEEEALEGHHLHLDLGSVEAAAFIKDPHRLLQVLATVRLDSTDPGKLA